MRGIPDKVKRTLYVLFGTIFLGLGILGIVLPVLPTTPFLLLAAACYLRGSEKLHKWLIQHKIFGEFIQNYMEGKGIKRKQKIISIIFLSFKTPKIRMILFDGNKDMILLLTSCNPVGL